MANSTAGIPLLVFVDIETTGLDPKTDKITELAYTVGNDEVRTLYFGVTEVNDFIDNLTKYYARGIHKIPKSSDDEFNKFLTATEGNTIVAANPEFDASFLKENNLWNFKHNKLDIESYAMKALTLDFVPSMSKIHEILEHLGFDVPVPNHTAAGDVIAMRSMYYILRAIEPTLWRR